MNINTAYFAGGCFWCMTKPFDTFEGIEKVTSGYMGGMTDNPTYEDVKKVQQVIMKQLKLNTMLHFFHIINYLKFSFQ